MSACSNPFCNCELPERKRRTRKFCSDACRRTGWALRHVKQLIDQIGVVTFFSKLYQPKGENHG